MSQRCVRALHNVELIHRCKYSLPNHHRRRQHSAASSLSPEELKFALKITQQLVDRAAAGPGHGWKLTPTLRGEEKRSVQAIRNAGQLASIASNDKYHLQPTSEDGADLDEDLTTERSDPLNLPGTFVEFRLLGTIMHGVILSDTQGRDVAPITVLASTGEIMRPARDRCAFVIPALVPEDVALRCGLSTSGETKKEVMARVEVLRRIRELEKLVTRDQSRVAHRIDLVYPLVKAADPDGWSTVTVAKVVKFLESYMKTSSITHFAVHKHLARLSQFYVMDYFAYRHSQSFDVRPESHVEHINKVSAMLRMKNGPIDAFAERAKAVISSNRKLALESRNEPPSQQQLDSSPFTPDDIVIINFLRHSLRATRESQSDPYELGLSVIIKKLEACLDVVKTQDVFQCLVDLGVIPPWQDLISYSYEPLLYTQPPDKAVPLDDHVKQLSTTESPPITHGITQGAPRHDFGDLPVYVIDDVSAQELDDGISLESNPSEPDSEWVHVHIADPTSVISPKSEIARIAQNRSESCYLLNNTIPMLPTSLTHNGLSLGSTHPQEVLSFSFRIDSQGNIGDYKVRLGLVRNFHIVSYSRMDSLLGVKPFKEHFPTGVRGPTQELSSSTDLDGFHANNIRTLYSIARRLVSARLKLPTFIQAPTRLSISLPSKPPQPLQFDPMKTALYQGFPEIVYKITSAKTSDHGSRQLVSEFMKAACRVASRFCLDHGVPVLRRRAGMVQARSTADLDEVLALRDEDGYVDYLVPILYGISTPPSRYSLEPKMHYSLGVPEGEGYVRVTSPLRRYVDLLAHWQIKHALSNTPGKPPFSEEYLSDLAFPILLKERAWRRASLNHEKYWAMRALQRSIPGDFASLDASHFLSSVPCVTLTAAERNPATKQIQLRVRLPTLGFDAALICKEEKDFPLGTELSGKIESMILDRKPSVRLLEI